MSKKKKTSRGGVLVWLGIGLLCVAAIADVLIVFTDNYTRNLLFTVPLWVAGIACFALFGQAENKKNKQHSADK